MSVPQRLLDLPTVDCLYAGDELVVLRKRVTEALHERPTYLAMHALTIVSEGRQVFYDGAGRTLRVGPGQVGLMRRGLYGVTDLLARETGGFATTIVFFGDGLLREVLGGPGAPDSGTDSCVFPASEALRAWGSTLPQNGPHAPGERRGDAAKDAFRTLVERFIAGGGAAARAALEGLLIVRRRPLREFMLAHYDKPLTLGDYAALSGRSERSFRRDFKTRFGESPKRWLVTRRLERARELLAGGEQRVRVLAQAVGYGSTSHFIERYKARFGVTPGRDALATPTHHQSSNQPSKKLPKPSKKSSNHVELP